MTNACLVTGVRTPIDRYAGALARVRPDDMAAHVILVRNDQLPSVEWSRTDDVLLGCANQGGGGQPQGRADGGERGSTRPCARWDERSSAGAALDLSDRAAHRAWRAVATRCTGVGPGIAQLLETV